MDGVVKDSHERIFRELQLLKKVTLLHNCYSSTTLSSFCPTNGKLQKNKERETFSVTNHNSWPTSCPNLYFILSLSVPVDEPASSRIVRVMKLLTRVLSSQDNLHGTPQTVARALIIVLINYVPTPPSRRRVACTTALGGEPRNYTTHSLLGTTTAETDLQTILVHQEHLLCARTVQ